MADLFDNLKVKKGAADYTAKDIEVLEGLEPVRRRPGMYIGGTDETAMHHLVSEVFDNAMDEAVAGFATTIELELKKDGTVTVSDNGRGIPIDPHPKYPKKSALEVILTMLHSGGKFSRKLYHTSGGLHGVGISVVNALADKLRVEVVRDKKVFAQDYSRGAPLGKLSKVGDAGRRKGTSVTFHPDPEIFGKAKFKPARLYHLAKSKAYLFKGVEIKWSCDKTLISEKDDTPETATIHFPGGLQDYLATSVEGFKTVSPTPFTGEATLPEKQGRVEWAVHWTRERDGFVHSYCNTIPTSNGGTHETGLRTSIYKSIKGYGEMVGNKKAANIISDDVLGDACALLSLFYPEPQFQGQTKEKLVNNEVARLVENAVKDRFDHWLSENKEGATALLNFIVDIAEERISRRQKKELSRKSVTQKLRLPGKLADCTRESKAGTEIFIVEGDSAGGSAKQARSRENQAVLPLRGKILNVASATVEKIRGNQELADMVLALGCGTGEHYSEELLRYDKIIIMTDADVDGAHIASLLMTYFYQEMPKIIDNGHLYLAQPPLYRISQGAKNYYANNDTHKEKMVKELSKNRANIEIGRFKGLGEMTASQLKETTMDPKTRVLLKVVISDEEKAAAKDQVDSLMGKKPELRFKFIQEQVKLQKDTISDNLDV